MIPEQIYNTRQRVHNVIAQDLATVGASSVTHIIMNTIFYDMDYGMG